MMVIEGLAQFCKGELTNVYAQKTGARNVAWSKYVGASSFGVRRVATGVSGDRRSSLRLFCVSEF